METLLKDFRFALRAMRRRPVFTLVAVLSLALGIGANGAIFSLVNGLLLQPPPGVEQPDRLVRLYSLQKSFDWPVGISYPNYLDLMEGTEELLESSSGHQFYSFGVSTDVAEPPQVGWGVVTVGDYFGTLGVVPVHGRLYGDETDRTGEPVAVVSEAFWRERLGGAAEAIGSTVKLDGQAFTVIGVSPVGFYGTEALFAPELWVPLQSVERAAATGWLDGRDALSFKITARLRPEAEIGRLEAALEALTLSLAADFPDANEHTIFTVMPENDARLEAGLGGPMKLIATILLALVGLVLLIACANVANLLLARASARRKELSLRIAIGAGRWPLIRQMQVESLLLALAGGGIGILIAIATARILESGTPTGMVPLRLEVTPDLRVYAFTAFVSILAGVVFGTAPALSAARTDPAAGLKEANISVRGGRRLRLGSGLVVVQVAMSLVLLIGAGLFLRSLQSAQQVDIGLDPHGVVALTMDIGMLGRSEDEGRVFYRELERRLEQIPGTEAVALASPAPMDWTATGLTLGVGRDLGEDLGDELLTLASWVGPGYFSAVRTPILEGRAFLPTDQKDRAAVIIVNQTLAEMVWPGESAIGKTLRLEGREGAPAEVVGIAKNGKYRLLGESPRPYAYLPWEQLYRATSTMLIRTDQPPNSALAQARSAVQAIEPDLAIQVAQPMETIITSRALAPIQIVAALAGSFGLVGLVLAAIGLYGVMAFTVTQRTREIGVRMALGARASQVLSGVLQQGMRLAILGVLIGVGLSFALSRVLGSFLVGVSTSDPATFFGVVIALVLVAILASLVPALRASHIDPVRTLKAE